MVLKRVPKIVSFLQLCLLLDFVTLFAVVVDGFNLSVLPVYHPP